MEALFALAILLVFAIPVAVIYLLISNAGLRRRVAALEESSSSDVVEEKVTARAEPKSLPAKPLASPQPVTVAPKAPKLESDDPVEGPPKAIVMTRNNFGLLIAWIMQNWFYAVSAVSLALAGIFLVLYGVEQGLLPPSVRIAAAFAFGAALVGAGEYIRRRYGDDENSSTAYLPSTFSGAGIVTLFGAVLAARLLYGFIGPEIALVGMALVGAIALVLGWFYGPLLAGVGVIGAMAAPFIVGGSSDDPSWLLAYFAIVAVVGLAIDTLRRWAWVSVISLVMGFGAGALLVLDAGWQVQPFFVMYCALLVAAAIAIPVRTLTPNHDGTPLSLALFARAKGDAWPEFPTRLAGGAILAASIAIVLTVFDTSRADLFWIGVIVLAGMVLALLTWARHASALTDLAALPATALIVVVAGGARLWRAQASAAMEPEAAMPLMASILVLIGVTVSVVAAWRSLRGGQAQIFVAIGAAVFAPVLAIVIEVFWSPITPLGTYTWALHAMAIGAVMVVMAERFARADGPDERQRMSFAVLSALACIAFGVVIVFTTSALTTALAITVVAAAWLDRQFNLPLMGLYILAGIATIGYRLVVDPGLEWAADAPIFEMLLSHGGAALAFAVSWAFVKTAKRPRSEVLLESAVFSSTAILLSLLLYRSILYWSGEVATISHWSVGIGATIWIALGLTQLRRLEIGGALLVLRKILGAGFLLIGALQLALVVSVLNPVFDVFGNPVLGPRLFNTLTSAYLLPAVILALGYKWLRGLPSILRISFAAVSVGLAALWLTLTIRHFWRGSSEMSLPGIGQPELYSYTLALLVVGAGLFYQSLARSSVPLRKAGLVVIGLAVAKVFVIDISGLGGLIRVFSLMFLGLALAGLAWLNRWAAERNKRSEETEVP
ncbi:DUF2339 domain-containing protein [Yoonia sp. F2084L]|uniref:DUF2339 domain-containing protein n=1 Tax=Yoonia sp. F2084L TaxID=2926419 RepID=UPI001FF5CFA7|nr:DUF2339 domain-containing protein [Yoonia sp. F2084L]MCK0096215.1 DUF2339 domain-containing protein [Yoonia sp. F2084L]